MKVVAIISQHPELQALADENEQAFEEHQAKRQALDKEIETYKKQYWPRVEKFLKENKMVPADYDFDKNNVQLDIESDSVRIGSRQESHDISDMLASLLGKKIKGEVDGE